jgi:hypothetical protein
VFRFDPATRRVLLVGEQPLQVSIGKRPAPSTLAAGNFTWSFGNAPLGADRFSTTMKGHQMGTDFASELEDLILKYKNEGTSVDDIIADIKGAIEDLEAEIG